MAGDAARLAGLAAWRATQGIYQFDPDLYAALITTPVDLLPVEILTLLPEWGIYVETPEQPHFEGFFAHCDCDPRNRRPELRLLLNKSDDLFPIAVPLVDGMLSEAIETIAPGFGEQFAGICQPLISLVLYICSVTADFGHYYARPPAPVKTKRGPRIFPPDKPVIINTGSQIGALLRASRAGSHDSGLGISGDRGVAPHIRRAHWHSYWKGKPKRPELRWMHPILVNMEQPEERVRRVKSQLNDKINSG